MLRRYFTNLDGPVFALVNLPEVVKGALFARYSRSAKSLRRLFLDEFVNDLDIEGDESIDATMGLARAEELYEKVFLEYGDDSVAQLGGVHLACEQASNILTKILEWGRLMSYLEQSTRYISYDARLGGRYRFFRDPAVLASPLGTRYVGDMDRMFDAYSSAVNTVTNHVRDTIPRDPDDSEFIYRQATRAKALDATRGMLPAASLSNLGHVRHRTGLRGAAAADARPPAPRGAALLDADAARAPQGDPELPAPRRPARPRRPLVRVPGDDPLRDDRAGRAVVRRRCPSNPSPRSSSSTSTPTPRTSCSPRSATAVRTCRSRCSSIGSAGSVSTSGPALLRAYVGERENRRHRPGRAFERVDYRFDILSDYGAFRDLQRHRLLTIEWQSLTPNHGYTRPELIEESGAGPLFDETMDRSARLFDAMRDRVPGAGVVRGVDGLPAPVRHAVQRPRGDAHARAPLGTAGPPVVSPGGARDASPDRRACRPPCDRRRDESHDDRGARARASRRGAASGVSTPG